MGHVILYRLNGDNVAVEVRERETVKDLLLHAAFILGTRSHLLELVTEGFVLDLRGAAADLCGAMVTVVVRPKVSEETINEAFRFLDEDGNGAIDVRELRIGWEMLLGVQPSNKQLMDFIVSWDFAASGTLDFDQFRAFMQADEPDAPHLVSVDHEDLRLALIHTDVKVNWLNSLL